MKKALDLADPRQLLDTFIRVEGDASGREHVLYGYGTVYSFVDGQPDRALVDSELFSVRRYQRHEGGWIRLHREARLYRDPITKQILTRWRNPYTLKEVDVIDLHNDYSRKYDYADVGRRLNIGASVMGDTLYMQRHFFVDRVAEMQPRDYPLHVNDDHFELAEYWNFFARLSDVEKPELASVPAVGHTSSISNFFPWMEMGSVPGRTIFQIRNKKLSKVTDMPASLLEYIGRRYPAYLSAPTEYSAPDEATTGMGFYKRIIDEKLGRPKS